MGCCCVGCWRGCELGDAAAGAAGGTGLGDAAAFGGLRLFPLRSNPGLVSLGCCEDARRYGAWRAPRVEATRELGLEDLTGPVPVTERLVGGEGGRRGIPLVGLERCGYPAKTADVWA